MELHRVDRTSLHIDLATNISVWSTALSSAGPARVLTMSHHTDQVQSRTFQQLDLQTRTFCEKDTQHLPAGLSRKRTYTHPPPCPRRGGRHSRFADVVTALVRPKHRVVAESPSLLLPVLYVGEWGVVARTTPRPNETSFRTQGTRRAARQDRA